MPRTSSIGRHENGQNFLVNTAVIDRIIAQVAATDGPILEIGPGGGALTAPLTRLNRPITAVEVDSHRARALVRRLGGGARIIERDYLRYQHPSTPHAVVSSVPFHLTTAILRKLLREPGWNHATLLVQWEVARRRAGVGGASLLTAQWWPWYDFSLLERVPAHAFRPMPSVDGGVITISRRMLLPVAERNDYQRFVQAVFTGRGRSLAQIVAGATTLSRREADAWLASAAPKARLPKQLSAANWVSLWSEHSARSASHRARGSRQTVRRGAGASQRVSR
ncbi:23S ribosomal RNA methyltransferase Erm [Paramicrobacterium chengjingii]|uniref:23S ribosomal RNA methyltransferase Erm n=1 Tax=Paramicrobacterium chengjingii TaxID=2769067 RepID=A0ABX6YHE3_9MICO|nr:23S ribosomal RNA methyltransferase Erm [Microbacterium chengjingii]QPZ38014.1 23S ribosomal RNA methyltransferase Erm [Microbacterium chengjingii]